MFDIFKQLVDWLWLYPILILLVGGGIIMSINLNFFQILKFPYIIRATFGKIFKKAEGNGTITPFQAATSALASTIGAANIVGVPIAIATGGPGAIFWMWIIAIFGCALKYSEIILGIKSNQDVETALAMEGKIVFTLYGSVTTIPQIVKRFKQAGKTVFVNVDFVEGFSEDRAIIEFMKKYTVADGIISSKAPLLRYAKQLGFITIHRFFVVDSIAYRNIGKKLEDSHADMINVIPGWSKTVKWIVEEFHRPVVSSGFVCDKEAVIDNLKVGAVAICSTNPDMWVL